MTIQTMLRLLSEGMLSSIGIFALTLLFSLPLGLVVALGRMSKCKPLSFLIRGYIAIMRGTPLMLQLLVVYFGPSFIPGVQLSLGYRFYAVIIGFTLNYAAYFAEIYRSGIMAIPKGQYEAAEVLGYNRRQTFCRIILPQVIKIILPSVTNEVITLVKDTSLAYAIAYSEMFSVAKKIVAAEGSLIPFLIAGVFYFLFNMLVTVVMERIEKHFSYYN